MATIKSSQHISHNEKICVHVNDHNRTMQTFSIIIALCRYSKTKRYQPFQCPTQEPKHVSPCPSSTTPWPTSKTANELMCFILLFMLWTVYCVMCILYRVLYIVSYAYSVHFYITVYILPIQLLSCTILAYNKRLSCLVLSTQLA